MINQSVVAKLWLAVVTLLIIVLFCLGLFLSQFFEDFYFSLKADELRKSGEKIANMISTTTDPELWESELSLVSRYTEAHIIITDRSGLIRAYNMQGSGIERGSRLQYPDVEKILRGQVVAQQGKYPGVDTIVLAVGVPIKANNKVIGAVFLNQPVEPLSQTVRTVQKFILIGAISALFLATVLAFLLTRTIVKPILNINRVALGMAKGNFSERVVTESEDEIGMLGSTLNYLSSELEKNIDALSRERDQLENILTSMTDAVLTIDNCGKIVLINPPARLILKLNEQDQVPDLEHTRIPDDFREKFKGVLAEGKPAKGEITVDGQILRYGMNPLLHMGGEIRGVVTVLHDVTKDRRLEMLRREFVANVSHELRSPLSLLQGYVEALADGLAENEEERQKYLSIILDETLRLRRLVNDLLDLTQLETGNMNMKIESLSVEDVISRVVNRFDPIFREQNKDLQIDLPENLPFILGDDDKLQQVMINLLDNAMKYTPPQGKVEVGAVNLINQVEIYVQDTGPGIPQNELPHVWERFYKIDKARTRNEKSGTGLGLAIVKNIVQNLGGEVKVVSRPGQGSRFSIVLNAVEEAV